MREQFNNTKYTHVIYGLDADLIFLSLSSNFSSLYLLREGEEFGKHSIQFNYVDIDQTKVTINEIMNDRVKADVAKDYKKQTELKKNANMTIEQKLELDKSLKKLYKANYEIIETEDKPRKCLEYCCVSGRELRTCYSHFICWCNG